MAANDKNGLSQEWTDAVLSPDPGNRFVLRPRQLLIAPADVKDAEPALPPGWTLDDSAKTTGALRFRNPTGNGTAGEVLEAIAQVRAKTAGRPQGPVRIAPNHVLSGEQPQAVTFTGEPRIQGGNATCARPETRPPSLPLRTTQPGDGHGVTIAVLDTGLFRHPWLVPPLVSAAGNAADTWDADGDGFGDAEAGHGTFVSGLIRQVAPAAHILDAKVLDSHGVGDDFTVAQAIERLPAAVTIVNLSLGGYTDDDSAPLAIAGALRVVRSRGGAIVAAAGNAGERRPFWPAAFKQVVGVGAADFDGSWARPQWSNYGYWVDAVSRGSNVASTYRLKAITKFSPQRGGRVTKRVFDGWARWDGTSFSTPVVAAYLARLITRHGLSTAQQAVDLLLTTAPPAPQPDYPLAVLVDDIEPGVRLP
jgi:Subtilase family